MRTGTLLLALLMVAGCDGWPGLEDSGNKEAGAPGASQLEDTSGRFGSSCSGASCQVNLTCAAGLPGGMCTRECQSNADCSGGVCVPTGAGLLCLPTCLNDQTCRPGYACQSTGDATVCAPPGSFGN